MKTLGLAAMLLGALSLGGCAVTPQNAYPQAMSVAECYNYGVAEQRARRAGAAGAINVSNSATIAGSLVGLVIGTAIANDVNRTRIEQCASRFGGTPADIDAITAARRSGAQGPARTSDPFASRPATAPAPAPGCVPGGGVMQGGAAICAGY